ncbi:MAG: replicative DNA helicase [Bryobacteraceae bacterium]
MNCDLPLPDNLDAERFVLGAAMSDPDTFAQIADLLEANDFSLEKHKRIFLRMLDIFERGKSINYVSVANELDNNDQLQLVGGISYLTLLSKDMPALANLESFCTIVRDKAILRRTIVSCQNLINRCLCAQEEPGSLLAEAERVTEILNSNSRKLAARTVDEVIEDEGGINAFLSPESRPGIHIPFEDIHHTLGGLRRSKLILLGARPAVGKTALASQIAEHAAANGHNVLVVTLEMGARDVLHRAITGRARVSAYCFRTGRLHPQERYAVQEQTGELSSLGGRLRLVDKSETTVPAIAALLRSLAARGQGCDLLIVDYLQLLNSVGYLENRVQEISAISRGLKRITQHFEIPVLALSQLARKGAQSTEEPQLDWLKESGQLEQDADQVLFLWPQKERQEREETREISWRVAKNRDGILNHGALTFYTRFCRFEELVIRERPRERSNEFVGRNDETDPPRSYA